MTTSDELWDANWGGSPVGSELKTRFPDRWVRFHSLPGSKRYADDEAEYAEIERRHAVVIDELRAGSTGDLLLIGADGAPFRALAAIRPLLRSIADGGGESIVITDASVRWLYHPYDGGGDAFAPTPALRDELRARHPGWLSSRNDGL